MDKGKFLVSLAKKAVQSYCQKKEKISPPPETPTEFLQNRAGVFVSIKKEGKLRGCIGTYLPCYENIAQETIENAILAAFFDDRFPPIVISELPSLFFTVYILGALEIVKDIHQLDPKKYGILIKSLSKNKSALLLPDLKEITTVEEQILAASEKGGINLNEEKILIFRFPAQKYEDDKN